MKLKNHNGFTLIELIIAIALSTIVSLILYNLLSQSSKTAQNIETLTDLDRKNYVLYRQLYTDLSCAFLPTQLYELEMTTTGTQQAKVAPEQEKKFTIEQPFFAQDSKDNIGEISFITTNALQNYPDITPNVVRVVYRLLPDKESPPYFKLFRQQSNDLSTKVLKDNDGSQFRMYEIADGIRFFKAKYFDLKKDRDANKETLIEKSAWNSDEMEKEKKNLIPEYVELEYEILNDQKKKSAINRLLIKIYGNKQRVEKAKVEPDKATTGTNTKPPAAGVKK